jgi:pimeloyl-ACP methyl ester carboxylesterase
MSDSNITTPTQFLQTKEEKYAYRRFGKKSKYPLLFLQHFAGTLDNRDPCVTDPLVTDREVILFENAGVGRSTGKVPTTMAGMAAHVVAFLDTLRIDSCDVLGFSLGGVTAQQMVPDNPKVFRKMIFAGTAPRGGEDIMRWMSAPMACICRMTQ